MQVMVIDMVEGFTREGPMASARVDALVPRQAAFLAALPPSSFVVFVADEHDPHDFELKRFPPHCLRGTRGAELRSELIEAAQKAEARIEIVRKNNFSGFFGTHLGDIVENAPTKSWVLIGCVTDCCIEANVAELVYRGRDVTVVRELIDTWDLSPAAVDDAGLSAAQIHQADTINDEWFSRRFPGIWGIRVADRWRELM